MKHNGFVGRVEFCGSPHVLHGHYTHLFLLPDAVNHYYASIYKPAVQSPPPPGISYITGGSYRADAQGLLMRPWVRVYHLTQEWCNKPWWTVTTDEKFPAMFPA